MQNIFNRYRKSVNPPYSSKDLLILGITFFILFTILLVAFFSQQRTNIQGHAVSAPYIFGTLNASTTYATSDYNAGIRLAEVELGWSNYEPSDGSFDTTYIAQMQQKIQSLRNAGFQISLGINLQYTPQWVLNLPNGNFMNQYGVSTSGPNVEFSQTVRNKAAAYITRVAQDLGTNFYSVRIGFSPDSGELLYPVTTDSANHLNSFWAYDSNAQNGGIDLPTNTTKAPFPGWKPGQTTYNGQPFTTTQADQWYQWYIQSLVAAADWEEATFKQAGFTGYAAYEMPGLGIEPFDYANLVNHYLAVTNGYDEYVAGRGAAWDKVIDAIRDKTNVQIQISSMADSSGNPWANTCQVTDDTNQITSGATFMEGWSDTRWIAYNADRYQLRKIGENPGHHDNVTIANAAAALMAACHLDGWYYAFDSYLYDSYPGAAQIADYASIISLYNGTVTPTSTPTPVSKLSLTVGFDGIGKAGDNVSRTSTGNLNPLHPQRTVTLTLSDVNNNPLPAVTGQVTYDSVSGLFKGIISLPPAVVTGVYTLKVSTPSFLQKAIPSIISITSGQTTVVPTFDLVAGDINNDNQISLLDYNQLLGCFGSSVSPCTPSDLDDDGIVGGSDYNLFLRELSVQNGG